MKQLCYITFPESAGFVKIEYAENSFGSMGMQ